MNKIINYLKENHSGEEDFNVSLSLIERFKNFHPVIIDILTVFENIIIQENQIRRGSFISFHGQRKQYSALETTLCFLHIVNKLVRSVSPYIKEKDTITFIGIDSEPNQRIKTFSFTIQRENISYPFNIGYKSIRHFPSISFLVKTDLKKSVNVDQKGDNLLISEILRDYKIHIFKLDYLLPSISEKEKLELRLQSGYKWKQLNESEKYSPEGQKLLYLFDFGDLFDSRRNAIYKNFKDKEFKSLEKYMNKKIKDQNKTIKSMEKKIKNFKLRKDIKIFHF